MAEGLASAGASLVLTSRSAAEVESVAARIESEYGQPVLGLEADVTSESACAEVVSQALARFGQIDILVNNAGIGVRAEDRDRLVIREPASPGRTPVVDGVLHFKS